jgi:hypothetical protein
MTTERPEPPERTVRTSPAAGVPLSPPLSCLLPLRGICGGSTGEPGPHQRRLLINVGCTVFEEEGGGTLLVFRGGPVL